MTRQLLGLSGFAIGIPLLFAWGKVRFWEWQKRRLRK